MAEQQFNRDIKIIQIYPFNNPVTKIKTKPVVMAGLPYITFSKYFENIMIISTATNEPYNDKVVNIKAKNKKDYYKNIFKFLSSMDFIPKVIEVHQDVSLAVFIAKKFNNKVKVCVIKHGVTLYKSFHDKIFFVKFIYEKLVLSKLAYVYSISNYITDNLKRNYPKSVDKFVTIYNTYGHINPEKVSDVRERDNIVAFVGKPLKFKGIFIFLKAILKFLKITTNWQAIIIGAKFSKKSKYGKLIKSLSEKIKRCDIKRLFLFEGIPIEEVFNKMKQSKIIVIPCINPEPFCLVALEAHMAGCIVISSGRGALREVSGDYAYYLNNLNAEELLKVLVYIDNNSEEAAKKALLGH